MPNSRSKQKWLILRHNMRSWRKKTWSQGSVYHQLTSLRNQSSLSTNLWKMPTKFLMAHHCEWSTKIRPSVCIRISFILLISRWRLSLNLILQRKKRLKIDYWWNCKWKRFRRWIKRLNERNSKITFEKCERCNKLRSSICTLKGRNLIIRLLWIEN